VLAQPLHPGELIVELLGADRIAVGKIEAADDKAAHLRFDIAALQVLRIAGQAKAAQLRSQPLVGSRREDRHAVEALLPVPEAVIAGGADILDRQGLVGALDLLEAQDIRLLFLEIFDEPRQPGADAVEVVGDELHGCGLAGRALPVIHLVRSGCGASALRRR
jgi:hypothetical protein